MPGRYCLAVKRSILLLMKIRFLQRGKRPLERHVARVAALHLPCPLSFREVGNTMNKKDPARVLEISDPHGPVAYARRPAGPDAARLLRQDVEGLVLAERRLAGQPDFAAPKLLDFSFTQECVITTALPGICLHDLLASAPCQNRGQMRAGWIERVAKWLCLVHGGRAHATRSFDNMSGRLAHISDRVAQSTTGSQQHPLGAEMSLLLPLLAQVHAAARGALRGSDWFMGTSIPAIPSSMGHGWD